MQSRHLERINELVREKRTLLGVNNQLRERNAELERESLRTLEFNSRLHDQITSLRNQLNQQTRLSDALLTAAAERAALEVPRVLVLGDFPNYSSDMAAAAQVMLGVTRGGWADRTESDLLETDH